MVEGSSSKKASSSRMRWAEPRVSWVVSSAGGARGPRVGSWVISSTVSSSSESAFLLSFFRLRLAIWRP